MGLGRPGLFPHVDPPSWSNDAFYGQVEVFHDLVARPRLRSYHDYGNCGWHYDDFSVRCGRKLYRAKVNALFERCLLPLRLATASHREVVIVPTAVAVVVVRPQSGSRHEVVEHLDLSVERVIGPTRRIDVRKQPGASEPHNGWFLLLGLGAQSSFVQRLSRLHRRMW